MISIAGGKTLLIRASLVLFIGTIDVAEASKQSSRVLRGSYDAETEPNDSSHRIVKGGLGAKTSTRDNKKGPGKVTTPVPPPISMAAFTPTPVPVSAPIPIPVPAPIPAPIPVPTLAPVPPPTPVPVPTSAPVPLTTIAPVSPPFQAVSTDIMGRTPQVIRPAEASASLSSSASSTTSDTAISSSDRWGATWDNACPMPALELKDCVELTGGRLEDCKACIIAGSSFSARDYYLKQCSMSPQFCNGCNEEIESYSVCAAGTPVGGGATFGGLIADPLP